MLVKQERLENMTKMEQLKEEMEAYLSSGVRLLNDLQTTKKLADLMKQDEETYEGYVEMF